MKQSIHACPHCGGILTKGRSLPDHRRFFALVHAAYHQWPESHEFQPRDVTHLRAWLTCKAGYRDTTQIELPDNSTADMRRLFTLSIESAIKASGGTAFVVPYRDCVVVITPRSIAWDQIDQKEFNKVRDAVSDLIEDIVGVRVDRLLRERAA